MLPARLPLVQVGPPAWQLPGWVDAHTIWRSDHPDHFFL